MIQIQKLENLKKKIKKDYYFFKFLIFNFSLPTAAMTTMATAAANFGLTKISYVIDDHHFDR